MPSATSIFLKGESVLGARCIEMRPGFGIDYAAPLDTSLAALWLYSRCALFVTPAHLFFRSNGVLLGRPEGSMQWRWKPKVFKRSPQGGSDIEGIS